MRPSEGIETLTKAWNTWYHTWKRTDSRSSCDHHIPLRMRGYLELSLNDPNVTDRERKEIDTSLKRGYTLSKNNRTRKLLDYLLRSRDFYIGYMGKSNGSLWFPDSDVRDRCLHLCEAQLVMTQKFSAGFMSARGDKMIRFDVKTGQRQAAHLSELRLVIDEFMAEWAQPREQFARELREGLVVRVPFDSFKERK